MYSKIVNENPRDKLKAIMVLDGMFLGKKCLVFKIEYGDKKITPAIEFTRNNLTLSLRKIQATLPKKMQDEVDALFAQYDADASTVASGSKLELTYDKIKKTIIDQKNQSLVAGLIPISCTMRAALINNNDKYKALGVNVTQEDLSYAIAKVARVFTSLSHIKYRDEAYSDQAIFGQNTDEFDCIGVYSFKAKDETLPSIAIDSIFEIRAHDLILDCMTASQIIYYKAILSLVGEDKFNEMFSDCLLIAPNINENHPLYSMLEFSKSTTMVPLRNPRQFMGGLSIGDRVYFNNIQEYLAKHPSGHMRGINLFYLGRNESGEHTFGGMVESYNVQTYDMVMQSLADSYNSEPLQAMERKPSPKLRA